MPRVKKLVHPHQYRGYVVNDSYTYNQKVLDEFIINPLEYFRAEGLSSGKDYQVIEATITVRYNSETYYDTSTVDDPAFSLNKLSLAFDPKNIRKALDPTHYWWCWTKEYSCYRGMHYHLMIIYCNGMEQNVWHKVQKSLEPLNGVISAFVSSRQGFTRKRWCHYLNDDGEHGIDDAVSRYCYRAKMDQKQKVTGRRTFGRNKLAPLLPLNPFYCRPGFDEENNIIIKKPEFNYQPRAARQSSQPYRL